MEPQDAYEGRERYLFIDVRQTHEWAAGHVEGAVHIPLQELPQRHTELDRAATVVVTCQIGQRSALATAFLREKGYDAHNLEGGLELWSKTGLSLVSGQGDE
jgi:rhodanese-related sulfurtransferase